MNEQSGGILEQFVYTKKRYVHLHMYIVTD